MKLIFSIILTLVTFYPLRAQLHFYQDVFKGGITSDGVSYHGWDYQQPDTINFQLHIPSSSTVRKAFLLSLRSNNYLQQEPDNSVKLDLNGNVIYLDSNNIVTKKFDCSYQPSSHEQWIVSRDVTSNIQSGGNKLIVPCQGCLMSSDTTRHYYYMGFLLIVMYDDISLPVVNVNIFFNDLPSLLPTTDYTLSGLNPINNTKDVGLSIWTDDVNSGTYSATYSLTSSMGNYTLGTIYATPTETRTTPGSFYYENGTLNGLVDDTPDSLINHTDALANIKNYLSNSTSSFTLTSSGGSDPACINMQLGYILSYSSPCPPRSNPSPVFTYTSCTNTNVQLMAGSGSSYTWYPSSGLSSSSIADPIASPTTTTNYIVSITDAAGCSYTEQHHVSVYTIPKTDSLRTTNAICGDLRGIATILAPLTGWGPYMYNVGLGNQANNTISGLNAGVYSVTVTNSKGCSYTSIKTFTITETNPAIASFNFNPVTACVSEPVNFHNTSGSTNGQWWNFNTGDTSNLNNPAYVFSDTGSHIITLIAWHNQRQCSDTIFKTIHVKECPPDSISIIPPNIFTPNGDDINEVWQPVIYNLGYTISEYKISIFDRWGLTVFETSDVKMGWDGRTTSGISCTEGTFYYVVDYKANSSKGQIKKDNLKGFLQLLK